MAFERAMSQEVSSSKTEYSNLIPGEYEGRLVYVADLGMQERNYAGEEKPPCQQISLCVEVLDNTVTIDGKEAPRILWTKPFNIFRTMSGLGKELEYYKAFKPSAEEGQVADWESALGMPCTVVIKNKQVQDKVYDEVAGLAPIPAKYRDSVSKSSFTDQCLAGAEDSDSPAIKSLFGLAKYIHEKRITESNKPELKAVKSDAHEEFDDDIPF